MGMDRELSIYSISYAFIIAFNVGKILLEAFFCFTNTLWLHSQGHLQKIYYCQTFI